MRSIGKLVIRIAGLAALAGLIGGVSAAAYPGGNSRPLGCTAAGAGASEPRNARRVTPLNPSLVATLTEEALLNQRIGLNSRIYLCDELNAFAAPDGRVYFGQPLANKFIADYRVPKDVWAAISFVLSHEFGHEFQFKMQRARAEPRPVTPVMELQADVLGAYWCGLRLREQAGQYRVYGIPLPSDWEDTWSEPVMRAGYDLGDSLFNDPQHHGTKQSRKTAVDAGIFAGRAGRFGSPETAFRASADRIYDWSKAEAVRIYAATR